MLYTLLVKQTKDSSLRKVKENSPALWHTTVVSATQGDEAGEPLALQHLGLPWVWVTLPSLGSVQVRDVLFINSIFLQMCHLLSARIKPRVSRMVGTCCTP
jgi:hypothetical protein